MMLLFTTSIYAESGYAEHALMVHRLSYWAPEYLTVTNNWNNMFFSNAPSTLKSLSVITEVDGQSTKDMEPEDFYKIIDNANSFSITYMSKIRGENRSYTHQLVPKKGKLFFVDYSSKEDRYDWSYYSDERWFFDYMITKKGTRVGLTPKESTTLMSDQNTDFFPFCSFAYMVSGDDYMIDLGLVQSFSKELERKGLKYNSDNPDIYLYLTKDSRTSIETIYVPNIVSTTHSTSNTIGHLHIYYGNYSAWGSGSTRTTNISTTNTQDVGHTKTIVDADLYLQLSILDAKKMSQPNPPVVWQMIHNHHFEKETNALEWAKRLHVAVFSYPLSKHNIGRRVFTWGLFFQDYLSKSGLICDVADGGWADKNGIHQGSTFKKAVGINRYWKNYSPGNGKEPKENIFNEHQNKKILFDNKNISSPSQEDFECHYFFVPESVAE